jgi:P-type conjugative transfer protein TrbJ
MIRLKTLSLSAALAAAVAVLTLAPVERAEAFTCPQCATELTQYANNLQLAAQYAKQIDQYRNQLEQWDEMLKQGAKLDVFQWTQAAQTLRDLSTVVQQGRALAYSTRDLGGAFNDRFQDYQREDVLFDDLLDDWAETSMDSIKGAMLAANRQADEFESEEEVFAEFRNLSSSVDGQMEAISVGNQIAVEQAVQMQKLRQLMMAQMQAQNAYMASDQAREEETRQRMKEMLREPTREEVRASYNGT